MTSESLDQQASPTDTVRRIVQPFSRAMIRRVVERADLAYLRDARDDLRVDFAYDDDLQCAPSFWLMATGPNEEIFGIEGRSTRRFPADMSEWCLFVCNEWNKRFRYPKAYFYVSDSEQMRTGEIRLEHYVDLEAGAHEELVDTIVHSIMGACLRFWAWLNEQTLQYTLARTADDRLDG